MTPEQIEKRRKRFEELVSKKNFHADLDRYESGGYRNIFINGAWCGYLLCAENMEVDLPGWWWCNLNEVTVYTKSEVDQAIESQGIKIKSSEGA